MAFNLGMPPDEAKRMFLNPGDLIFRDDTAWLPVEVTMLQEGFLKAWEMGAKQWREHDLAGNAGFFPIHEAWSEYEPVGLTGTSSGLSFPEQELVMEQFAGTVNRFVEREIADKVAALEQKIRGSHDPARLQNKLGVLYAQYGIMDKAQAQFEAASRSQYAPGLINLGNIFFINKDYDAALEYFEQANELKPGSSSALVGIAKVNYELENHGTVKRTYQEIQRKDPDLAVRFSYLASGESEDTARASSVMIRETVVWDEEE
jgi:tetratricopeptide (TPR) repeat protein